MAHLAEKPPPEVKNNANTTTIVDTTSILENDRTVINDKNRPIFHFTPPHGWMNDPNGLFFDKHQQLWHVYYQYNPNGTTWDLPLYWGHATSKDLTNWEHHDAAISPDKDNEGVFSGSIVVDHNNTSGFFNDSVHPDQRVVAIYTTDSPSLGLETQDVAYSLDGGYTFTKYNANPVLDVNSPQFRDPKVFWHKPSSQWIMVVAKTQEYKVQFFKSSNLKNWTWASDFSGGYPGYQYECPGLAEVPVANSKETKWVLFLSINPGSPNGGSINQYFIGDFDGTTFNPVDNFTRFVDLGKDFYALQTFSDVELAKDGTLGVAWASNWQYANKVPSNGWRSSLSLVRKFSLDYVKVNPENNLLSLIQTPVINAKIGQKVVEKNCKLQANKSSPEITLQGNASGVFDFELIFNINESGLTNSLDANLEIVVSSANKEESLIIGFDPVGQAFYVDRGLCNSKTNKKYFNHALFNDKISTYVEHLHLDSKGLKVYKVYGIVDKNIVELYFNNGTATMTNTFFMSPENNPASVEVKSNVDEIFFVENVVLRELSG